MNLVELRRVPASCISDAEANVSPAAIGEQPPVFAPPPVPPPQQVPPPLPDASAHEGLEDVRRRQARFLVFAALPGGLTSLVVHLGLLISLAVYALTAPYLGDRKISVEVVQAQDEAAQDLLEELTVDIPPLVDDLVEEPLEDTQFWEEVTLDVPEQILETELMDLLAPSTNPAHDPVLGGGVDSGFVAPRVRGGELATRAQRRRQALAYGATMDSENAVDLALTWLARHQRRDGSWSFQHREGDHHCVGCLCSAPGRSSAENGATGMVLLALLGAGQTHLDGEYREVITGGLRYLITRQKPDGSLMDPSGNMYSHGVAALALCEALAMTRYRYPQLDRRSAEMVPADLDMTALDRVASGQLAIDPRAANSTSGDAETALDPAEQVLEVFSQRIEFRELEHAAQRAVQFIEYAQHARGGWRYSPMQPGDTSVVGWQLMALKSGYLAGLSVEPQVVRRSVLFLDHVADDKIGSCYGYTSGQHRDYVAVGPASATTAIGLLCRMYTGWQRNNPGMTAGVERLMQSRQGNRGMYFTYYAMQVMHHYGGEQWRSWNESVRGHLVKQQRRRGREAGSWSFNGAHDNVGGRLYCTAMAAMCLEVYYRYSPIYSEEVVAAAAAEAAEP